MPADAERPSAQSPILPHPQRAMAPGVTLNLETVTSAFTPDANSPASATGTASTTATASKSTSPRPASPSHFHHPGSQTHKSRSSPALNPSAPGPRANGAMPPSPPSLTAAHPPAAHPPAASPARASKAPPRPASKAFGAAKASSKAKAKASVPKLAPGEKALCERCAIEHDGTVGSGRFCSIRCARKKAAARKWEKQRAKDSADGKVTKADGAKSEGGKSARAGAAARAQQGPVAKRQRTTPSPLHVARPSPVAGRPLHMPAPLSSYGRPALKLAMGFPVVGGSSSGSGAGGGQMPFSAPMPRAMGPPLPQSRHAPVTGIGVINSATDGGGGGGMSRGHVAPVPLRPVPQYYDRPSYSSFTPPYFQSPQAQGGLFAPSPGAAATPPPPPPPTPAPLEAGVALAHNFAPQAQVSSRRECQSVAEALLTLGTAPSPAPGMMRGMTASPAPGFPRGMTPSPLPGGLPRGMTSSPAPPMGGMMSGSLNGRAPSSAPGPHEG